MKYYNQLLKIKYYDKEMNGILMLYQFFNKLYKNEDKYKNRILVRCFYRISKYFNNNKYFPCSYKISQITEKLLHKVNYNKFYMQIRKIFQNNDIFCEEYCDNLKQKFTEISDDKLNELNEIFNNIENEMNKNIENNIYVISSNWFIYTKYFIKHLIEKRNKKEDSNSFIEKSIEPRFLIDFEEIIKSYPSDGQLEGISIIPGLINNFDLINFKDLWKENNDDDNYELKKNLTLNKDYLLINENDWDILSAFFGYIFKVTNKYLNVYFYKIY